MSLPQELVDKIIDEIWISADDPPSNEVIKAISLISRSWVDRSQRYLFRHITFSVVGRQFERWCNAVAPGPNGVSRHVQSLTIQATGSDGWWINEDLLEQVLPYFDSFRNVEVFRVLNWNVDPFPPEAIARCFSPFGQGVRLLQWDPYQHMTREAWAHIVGLFPRVDHLLLLPGFFPAGLISNDPVSPLQKRLVFSGDHAARYLTGGRVGLRFQEIYARCGTGMTLETLIAIINCDADWLEVLSIAGIRRGQTFPVQHVLALNPPAAAMNESNRHALASFLKGCRALRELSMDWLPVEVTPESYLVDAIPGGCIQSLRIMPDRALWEHMWDGSFSGIPSSALMAPYERMAHAILRLATRNSGEKISVWYVIPRAPYVMCDPVKDTVIAFWGIVESAVTFGFQMTEVELQNIERRDLIFGVA